MPPPKGFKALPLPAGQLSLAAVLKCGQSFRWLAYPLKASATSEPLDEPNGGPTHEYRFALRDRVVCLRQDPDTIFYRSIFPKDASDTSKKSPDTEDMREASTLAWLRDYFQLEVDLVKLYDEWAEKDLVFRETVKDRFSGIRMLRQDPWENVISFICSSNNHIGRITKMVQSLCTEFSAPLLSAPLPEGSDIDSDGPERVIEYHSFPSPQRIAEEGVAAKLRELGFGYRAEYIQRTAAMLCEEHDDPESFLTSLRKRPTEEVREELLKLCGVGPKVADCVLLMSMDKTSVVPVDTHVHQIALKYYGLRGTPQGKGGKVPMTPKIYEAVSTKLVGTWGDYAGWAHSVLFTADLRSFANYGLPTPEATTPTRTLSSPGTSVPVTPSDSGSDYFGDTPTKKRKLRVNSPSKLKRVRTE